MDRSSLRLIATLLIAAAVLVSQRTSAQSTFNPYRELADIQRFVFVSGSFTTPNADDLVRIRPEEFKNYVVLKVRTNLREIPYREVEWTQRTKADGRFYCELMAVDSENKALVAYHVQCTAAKSSPADQSVIWTDSVIGIVGNRNVETTVKGAVDRLVENFAGEFYKAKAQK